jgi:GNAT superfamily N-acetyltransferase
MNIQVDTLTTTGIRFSLQDNGGEIARAYLYLMHNDLHKEPFGLLEDVYVDEKYRGQEIGSKLIQNIIKTAKERNCYKLIATSRNSREPVHELYKKLGFDNYGIEFRLNF